MAQPANLYEIKPYTEIEAPQMNPFGMSGNPHAMKRLQLNLPQRNATRNNPFSNVRISDYGEKQKYGSSGHCGKKCKEDFYAKMTRSPDDALWLRRASERQYITAPVDSVPNEQTKFAEWLYGKNHVCKSGSIYDRYGYPYTPDSLVCDGYNAASPENAGQVENNYGTPLMYPHASFWANSNDVGYGLGGIPGGIPPPNMKRNSGSSFLNPKNYN